MACCLYRYRAPGYKCAEVEWETAGDTARTGAPDERIAQAGECKG